MTIGSTTAVIIAFAIPLGLLIGPLLRSQAEHMAIDQAQNVAIFLGNGSPSDGQIANYVTSQTQTSGLSVSVVIPNGTLLGSRDPGPITAPPPQSQPPRGRPGGPAGPALAPRLDRYPGGEVAEAVATSERGSYLVRAFVPTSRLTAGLDRWLTLLVGVSVFLALGSAVAGELLVRRLVKPLENVADVARGIAAGEAVPVADVSTGPREVVVLATTMNRLAERVDTLLTDQRRSQADLSHRLRTPLAALRLELDAVPDDAPLDEVRDCLAAVEAVVAHLRPHPAPSGRPLPSCDATAMVAERVEFWAALAADERRELIVDLVDEPLPVRVDAAELSAAVDALLDNVFAHTGEGVAFTVTLHLHGGMATLVVADAGDGYPASVIEARTADRLAGGIGLTQARRCAQAAGGSLILGHSPLGGAQATLLLGPA